MKRSIDKIKSAMIHDGEDPNENSLVLQHEKLRDKAKDLSFKISTMEDSDRKLMFGKQLAEVNAKINKCRKSLKDDRKHDVVGLLQSFRGTAGAVLPKWVYSNILHQANLHQKDNNYKAVVFSLLTDEENELIEESKRNKSQLENKSRKISEAKKVISELMPNFLGEISTEDYNNRVAITKMLNKINQSLT